MLAVSLCPVVLPVEATAQDLIRRDTIRESLRTPRSGEAGRLELALTFATGSADLSPAARRQLIEVADAMTTPPLDRARFAVHGHTDASGSAAANLRLSERRARSVVDFLVSRGVDRSRLQSRGFGESQLKDPSRPNSRVNRRVEIINLAGATLRVPR